MKADSFVIRRLHDDRFWSSVLGGFGGPTKQRRILRVLWLVLHGVAMIWWLEI